MWSSVVVDDDGRVEMGWDQGWIDRLGGGRGQGGVGVDGWTMAGDAAGVGYRFMRHYVMRLKWN